MLDDSLRLLGRDQKVQVSNGFSSSPEASSCSDLRNVWMAQEVFKQLVGPDFRVGEQKSPGMLAPPFDRLKQIGGGFCPKTREHGNASILGRGFHLGDVFDAELFIQHLGLLAT